MKEVPQILTVRIFSQTGSQGGGEDKKKSWELKGLLGMAGWGSKESKKTRCPALPVRKVKS